MEVERSDDKNISLERRMGREFVRQYYTKWSFHLNDLFQFYGDESFFHHDESSAKGQKEIRKLVEELYNADCKARILSFNATFGPNETLVVSVFGELSINKNTPRRFVQHFTLCKQLANKYFVQVDLFQWVDKAFGDVPLGQNSVKESKNLVNKKNLDPISNTRQNGHSFGQPTALLNNLNTLSKGLPVNDNSTSKERNSSVIELSNNLNNSNNYSSPVKPLAQQQQSHQTQPPKTTQQLQEIVSTPQTQTQLAEKLSNTNSFSSSQQLQRHQHPLNQSQQSPTSSPQSKLHSQTSNSQRSNNFNRPTGNSTQQNRTHFGQHQNYGQNQHQSYGQNQHQSSQHNSNGSQHQQFYRHQQQIKRQDSNPKSWAKAVSNSNSSNYHSNQNYNHNHNLSSAYNNGNNGNNFANNNANNTNGSYQQNHHQGQQGGQQNYRSQQFVNNYPRKQYSMKLQQQRK